MYRPTRGKAVAKMDKQGKIVDVYVSARSAGRHNHMSYQTVIDRCSGRCKSKYAPDGFRYQWHTEKKATVPDKEPGTHYRLALPPEQWPRAEMFLSLVVTVRKLVQALGHTPKIDLAAFRNVLMTGTE